MSRLFTLAGLYPGTAAEPLTHERLPLIDALTKWRHPLRQEAALLAAGLGPPQLRLVQANTLKCQEVTANVR